MEDSRMPTTDDHDDCFTMNHTLDEPAFAVLAGRYIDTEESSETTTQTQRVTFPIRKLPMVLGRTHLTEDRHFLGLGNCKALSRNHVSISYRDISGNKLEQQKEEDEFTYIPSQSTGKQQSVVIHPVNTKLPSHGFYVIECLGKNKLFVDKERVEQGQVALLKHGSTIKMASYCLYFLLPNRASDYIPREYSLIRSPPNKNNMNDKDPVVNVKRRKVDTPKSEEEEPTKDPEEDDEEEEESINTKDDDNEQGLLSSPTTKDSSHLSKVDTLDRKTTKELFQVVDEMIIKGIFNRTFQNYSSAIMLHGIRDLCQDLQVQNQKDKGLPRDKISSWLNESKIYGPWYKFLKSHMKPKSFDCNLTRALLKLGFGKSGTSGRYVNWIIPDALSALKSEALMTVEKPTS